MEKIEHTRVATYAIKEGTYQDVAGSPKTGMLPRFQKQPGFIRYGLADVGDRTLLSINVWKSHKEADASVPVAAAWVRDNLADRVQLEKNYIGDVAFFEGATATV